MSTSEISIKPEPVTSPSDLPSTPGQSSQASANPASVAQKNLADSTGPHAVVVLKTDSGIGNGAVVNPDGIANAAAAAASALTPVTAPNTNNTPSTTSTTDAPSAIEDTEALAAALIKAANAAAAEVGAPGAIKGAGEQPRRKRTRRGGWDTPAVPTVMPTAATAISAAMTPPVPAMTPMQVNTLGTEPIL